MKRLGCATVQERLALAVIGELDGRDRAAAEAHAARCERCETAYGGLALTSVAVGRAYAPLRLMRTDLSPARVRLAVRRPPATPFAARLASWSAKLTEASLAAAVTAFIFAASTTAGLEPRPTVVDETQEPDARVVAGPRLDDPQNYVRWIRIGRSAPIADVLDPTGFARTAGEDEPPLAGERSGLLR